jgi:cytochrome c oxidase cbb3-type subunit I/II
VYDSPAALGTERSGPDLAQIGGMRPTPWHQMHDRDPRSVSQGSLMPNFGFSTDDQIDAPTAYIQNLGQEILQVETSITNGFYYHPAVSDEYVNATNQFTPMLMTALAEYDVENDAYIGNATFGDQLGVLFDAAKADYTQFCLSCLGCSGNAEGPYARHVATQPANLHERIATCPGDSYECRLVYASNCRSSFTDIDTILYHKSNWRRHCCCFRFSFRVRRHNDNLVKTIVIS